jgi:putative hemolysin
MSPVATEIIFIAVLILANGVFALSEISVVSARRARLQQRALDGDARAQAALRLIDSPGKFLATVQVGITLIGVLAGAFGGATIAEQIAAVVEQVPLFAAYAETIGLLIVVIAITYFSLIIGELVPKQLGLNTPEQFALLIARPMTSLSQLAAPVVAVLNLSTRFVVALLRVRPSTEPEVTEEEIRVMISRGAQIGTFHQAERDMVERVFRLGDLNVEAFITPRTGLVVLDVGESVDEIRAKVTQSPYSRFPVVDSGIDHILGLVSAKAVLTALVAGSDLDLRHMRVKTPSIPSTTSALKALQVLRDSGIQAAFVIDEYGGLEGLVTLNSILEEIVSGALTPLPSRTQEAVQRSDGAWLLDGLLPIDELRTVLDLKELPDHAEYQTVGGLVMAELERIPNIGDSFDFEHWVFEVVDMDGHRVDKVLASPLSAGKSQSEARENGKG